MKIYGKTFLTKHRWFSVDLEKVENSFWMWGETERDANGLYRFGLSWLGVINGILYHLGDFRRIAAVVDTDKNNEILSWELRNFRKDR